MGRLYVIDAYNFVLQDDWLDRIVAEQGLEAARRTFRTEAESLARRTGCRIRLIYDGARGPFEHVDQFENQFVEASFTSSGEKADERVVAVALEMVRRGHMISVVSDDEAGVRQPLRGAAVTLLGTRDFAKLMRPSPGGETAERRAEALSQPDQAELARSFLARDAARAAPSDADDDEWAEIPRVELKPPPQSVAIVTKPGRPGSNSSARATASSSPPPAPVPPISGRAAASPTLDSAEHRKVKKERGARKQERRLALLKSTAKSSPSKKPIR